MPLFQKNNKNLIKIYVLIFPNVDLGLDRKIFLKRGCENLQSENIHDIHNMYKTTIFFEKNLHGNFKIKMI